MYRYALSVKSELVEADDWSRALKMSRLKRIEYSCGTLEEPAVLKRRASLLKSLEHEAGLEVASVHIPFWPFDMCQYSSADEMLRQRVVTQILDFVKLHYAETGCCEYTLHASGEPICDAERPALLEKVRRTLLELSAYVEKNVFINVELLPRSCVGNSAEELLALVTDLPENIGICLDVNHLGWDFPRLPELVRMLSCRLRSLHLSDYDGVDETHWFPGQGAIDWEKLMAAIRDLTGNPLLIFETCDLQAPAHQKRRVDSRYLFHQAEFNVFYLENIREFNRRLKDQIIP